METKASIQQACCYSGSSEWKNSCIQYKFSIISQPSWSRISSCLCRSSSETC
ncbi:unnamed protein product [Moneuplotes crassus]|uniref:Uncharacterized protein n=1 Tax=Euplotes crassus TaxID=5936 RepID=A0AAD2D486_EUPCR|nr:unnamed protein product [Moneuplotes crassus]